MRHKDKGTTKVLRRDRPVLIDRFTRQTACRTGGVNVVIDNVVITV